MRSHAIVRNVRGSDEGNRDPRSAFIQYRRHHTKTSQDISEN